MCYVQAFVQSNPTKSLTNDVIQRCFVLAQQYTQLIDQPYTPEDKPFTCRDAYYAISDHKTHATLEDILATYYLPKTTFTKAQRTEIEQELIYYRRELLAKHKYIQGAIQHYTREYKRLGAKKPNMVTICNRAQQDYQRAYANLPPNPFTPTVLPLVIPDEEEEI